MVIFLFMEQVTCGLPPAACRLINVHCHKRR